MAEAVGEIGVPRPGPEFEGLLKMLMGASKVAEIPVGDAGSAVRDQGLGAIRPSHGFAQEKLRHFARWCGFVACNVPEPDPIICRKPFRRVFYSVRQFAGARKGGTRFRRVISLGPDQRIAEAGL